MDFAEVHHMENERTAGVSGWFSATGRNPGKTQAKTPVRPGIPSFVGDMFPEIWDTTHEMDR